MTADRGVQPGVRQAAASDLDVARRLASLERAAGSGGGGGGGDGTVGPHDHPHDHDDEYAPLEHDHGEGIQGPQGPEGPQGPQGPQGPPGEGSDFDGEHVLTGDPLDPPADLAAGQLLWDGVEGGGSGGGAAGPHDHDYLPLEGGTLTGDLQVEGQIRGPQGSQTAPTYSSVNDPTSGFYAGNFGGNGSAAISVDGVYRVHVGLTRTRIVDDLQVDGGTEMRSNARSVRVFTGGAGNVAQLGFTSAGSETPAYGKLSGYEVWIQTGTTPDGLTTELKVGRGLSTFDGNVTVGGTINGQSVFGIAPDINTADVLDRAETATMPAVEEGVATTDAEVESITVNEVVTALLAKVKELSARIEELEGA